MSPKGIQVTENMDETFFVFASRCTEQSFLATLVSTLDSGVQCVAIQSVAEQERSAIFLQQNKIDGSILPYFIKKQGGHRTPLIGESFHLAVQSIIRKLEALPEAPLIISEAMTSAFSSETQFCFQILLSHLLSEQMTACAKAEPTKVEEPTEPATKVHAQASATPSPEILDDTHLQDVFASAAVLQPTQHKTQNTKRNRVNVTEAMQSGKGRETVSINKLLSR